MLRDAPAAIRAARVSMLLVDQTELAGGTIAERLGLPFITICNALAMNREPEVPPPFTPWSYSRSRWSSWRNRVGYAASAIMTRPIAKVVARYRREWALPAWSSPEDSFSRIAQISQQPPLFDFPRRHLPETFHYTGPLRRSMARTIPFPWERLNGRQLIYASLGTLQNSRLPVFRCFAEACEGLDAQLVITHGGGLKPHEEATLPGNPIVVPYAPQTELLARASLTLTHAGLNTVLDSLTFGVPMIAIPITYEQPAIAERLRYTGAGEIMAFGQLNPARLREAIQRVLTKDSFRNAAGAIAESIRAAGGVRTAADVILAVN
jgi:MGT family glycosyltransferase